MPVLSITLMDKLYFSFSIPTPGFEASALALPTSDHGVAGSNPAGGEILPEPKLRFIAQSLSCSPFHRLEMTEILLRGRKTLTHSSINPRFPPFLLYVRRKSGVNFIQRSFRDVTIFVLYYSDLYSKGLGALSAVSGLFSIFFKTLLIRSTMFE